MIAWRSLVYAPLVVLLIWAVIVDVRERRIPNWISFTLILSGFAQGIAHLHGATISMSLAGFAVGMLPVLLFLVGGMGAADVKLSAGIGAWLGPIPMLWVLAGACVVSMFVSLAMSLVQGRLLAVMRQSLLLFTQLVFARDPRVLSDVRAEPSSRQIPFAISLVVATFVLAAFASAR